MAATKKIPLGFMANFSFNNWLIVGNFMSFFAALRRFWPFNDGNQLPGCRLYSKYDVYILTALWEKSGVLA